MTSIARTTSSAAILSLVFGLLSWVLLPVVGAVVAVVAGHMARAEIRRGAGAIEGDGMAVAGLILGWMHLALAAAAIVAAFLFLGGLAFLLGLAGMHGA